MSKPAPTRYRTLNWSSYNASLCERGSLTVWFAPGMAWHAAPSVKRGRQQTFSDASIRACLMIRVLFGLPLRQTTVRRWPHRGEPSEAVGARLAGARLLDAAPAPKGARRVAALPGFGRPAAPARGQHRHQGPRRRRMACAQAWRGQAARVAQGPLGGGRGDAGSPRGQNHRKRRRRRTDSAWLVVADPRGRAGRVGDHGWHLRRQWLPRRHRQPRVETIIPPRRNARPWNKDSSGAAGRNEALRAIQRIARTIWHRWSGYHRRSRVETKMNYMKLLGQKLAA